LLCAGIWGASVELAPERSVPAYLSRVYPSLNTSAVRPELLERLFDQLTHLYLLAELPPVEEPPVCEPKRESGE
jgi:hypothetical protein